MVLYDFVAPFYDPLLRPFYRPFRRRALGLLPERKNAVILDLACGTGQNFPFLATHVGSEGKLIGVDVSAGMLRRAEGSARRAGLVDVSLLHLDATTLSPDLLEARTGAASVDLILCTYAFTAMADWETAFARSFALLKPGGGYLIHDIFAEKPTLHSRAVERVTRCDFSRRTWEPLRRMSLDFRMEFLDPSTPIFGGRLFVVYGTKTDRQEDNKIPSS